MSARILYIFRASVFAALPFRRWRKLLLGDVVENNNSLQDLLAGQGRIAVARLDGVPSDIRKDRISDKPVWYSFNLWACFFRESILCSVNRHAVRGAEFSALRAVYA